MVNGAQKELPFLFGAYCKFTAQIPHFLVLQGNFWVKQNVCRYGKPLDDCKKHLIRGINQPLLDVLIVAESYTRLVGYGLLCQMQVISGRSNAVP